MGDLATVRGIADHPLQPEMGRLMHERAGVGVLEQSDQGRVGEDFDLALGGLGRPHLIALASPSATGPRMQRAYYSDTANKIKGVQCMGIIKEFNAP